MDKVLISMDLWYKVLDALEDNKGLREQCYEHYTKVFSQDIDWIKGSLEDEGRKYPRVRDYLYNLAMKIGKDV